MLWFLRDYPLAAVLLRAATLAFDLLLMGGIFFLVVLLPHRLVAVADEFLGRARNLLRIAAAGLIVTQICFVALDSVMLRAAGGLGWADLYTANYFLAGLLLVAVSIAILFFSRRRLPHAPISVSLLIPLLFGIVWTSHSASRLEHRVPLMILTALHQFATAVWIGGMPFLWLLL
ncbi:MAG: hypothetical protein ABI164_11775, partial [Acidobacteriaceae bacterium]